jgi:transposase
MMKIQDVFNKAYQKNLTWKEVAQIMHVDPRTVRRWKETVEEDGFSPDFDTLWRQKVVSP